MAGEKKEACGVGIRCCQSRGTPTPLRAVYVHPGAIWGAPRSSSHMRSSAPTPAQVTGGYLRVTWAGSSRGHCPGRAPRRTDLTGALERAGSPTSLPGFGPLDGREDPENLASCRLERASAQTDAYTHKQSGALARPRAGMHAHAHLHTRQNTFARTEPLV